MTEQADETLTATFWRERPAILRYLLGRLASASDSEDLAQELWIKLNRNEQTARRAPREYMWRIAKNDFH